MTQGYYTFRISVLTQDKVKGEIRDPDGNLLLEPEGVLAYQGPLRQQIDQLVATAQNLQLAAADVSALGEALFKALFDAPLLHDLANLYETAVHAQNQLLRLELDIDEAALPEIAALPWEFMRVPIGSNLPTFWLSTAPQVIFSRRPRQRFPPKPITLDKDEKLRLAVVIAAPADEPAIGYQNLLNEIDSWAKEMSGSVQLLPIVTAATPDNIDLLLRQSPHFFHFVGHGRLAPKNGRDVGEIALLADNGGALWVDEDYFSDLLNQYRPAVVVLQAQESGRLSAATAFAGVASRVLQQNIPVVIAMQYRVNDLTAARFVSRFYRRLAEEMPVDQAAQDGRRAISLVPNLQYKTHDFASPTLFMRVADGRLFQRRLTTATPPDSVQGEQKFRDTLWTLNYSQQRDKFLDIFDKPRIGAFLITGPSDACGQRWLLNRLVQKELEDDYAAHITDRCKPITIRFNGLNRPTLDFFWRQLRKQLATNSSPLAEPDDILNGLVAAWQERDVVIVLDDVCYPGQEFPQKLLQEFWQPLVPKLKTAVASGNWCLLVMIDNKGLAALPDQSADLADPLAPIVLPPLPLQIPPNELRGWLRDGRTRLTILEPAQKKLNLNTLDAVLNHLLHESEDGVPLYLLDELCHVCNYEWSDLQEKWMKL